MSVVVNWLGCDLVTGRIIEELPDIVPGGQLGAILGAYSSTSFKLPLAMAGHGAPPANWEQATEPGRTMIVAVINDVPVWAGIILVRGGGKDAFVDLGCATLEAYLDRRFVGDHTWTAQDESSVIAAGLIGDAATEGIGFTVDAPSTGTTRDRAYLDQDDKTIYSALTELMGVDAGPEWTVTVGWADASHTIVSKTVRVRKRIGVASTPPDLNNPTGSANAVFMSTGASEAVYTLREDYSAGSGANHIVATSSGEGDSRPQSSPARATALLAAGWPRWEHRFTPSTSISSTTTLDGHATAALALMDDGANIVTITARADVYPVLGIDWALGDDIGYELVGHRHPNGLTGVARAIGWNLDAAAGTVSPILFTNEG